MQGGLADGTAPHEYGVTTAGQPSASSTSTTDQGDSTVGTWLSRVNLSAEDIFLLSSLVNLLAAGGMLIAGVMA
jgi:hypothetical protein